MLRLFGVGASGGCAIGELYILRSERPRIECQYILDEAAEIARYKNAVNTAKSELDELYVDALVKVGEQEAFVFEIHKIMLEDDEFQVSVTDIIKSGNVCAEYAVSCVTEKLTRRFSQLEDHYMRARAADIKDISDRVTDILTGRSRGDIAPNRPVIVFAEDLSPSQTIKLDRENVLAFITKSGSKSSHTAILARTMGIPAVIGLGECAVPEDADGEVVAVNGETGEVFISPDTKTVNAIQKARKAAVKRASLLAKLKGRPSVTKSGWRIVTCANIGRQGDLQSALDNDAEGIGLFRTELLFIEHDCCPSEQVQFISYKMVVEAMRGKCVTLRTLDIGSDKQLDYFNIPKEENPALGVRGVRLCLARPEIFKTQLRAMYRASYFGKAQILFPMITSVEEVLEVKRILAEVTEALERDNINFDKNLKVGIMIETPAAAIISGELAKHVDFFSIGTNDLSQYTLAIDRGNENLNRFFDPYHPAVMELIRITAENAKKNGIKVQICGELAADITLTQRFAAMGIDELSVVPSLILPLREKILECL